MTPETEITPPPATPNASTTLADPASTGTYRAVQAVERGRFALAELPLRTPGRDEVRITVEACGVCHSDSATVEAAFPVAFPRVPGHEVVGRIDAIGEGVTDWTVGQRVGVGFLAGHCGHCVNCRRGDFVACLNQGATGVHTDGGYAESMIARTSGLVRMPDELDAVAAAPLLCAGLTTFQALRESKARAGDRVAILGIGGLGHLAVQYARKMGFHVVAIARGAERAAAARELGAHVAIDSTAQDAGAELQRLGGVRLVLATAGSSEAMSALVPGLLPGGELISLGIDGTPLTVTPLDLIFGNSALGWGTRSATGMLTGTVADNEDTLAFSVLQGIGARVETVPLEQAPQAYARMLAGGARYRIVLDVAA